MSAGERDMRLLQGRRVQLKDLVEEGLLGVGARLEFPRPRSGEVHSAEVTVDGRIRLSDGREFAAPSRAAMEVADLPAIDGWSAWIVAGEGVSLFTLRQALLSQVSQTSASEGAAGGDEGAAVGPDDRHSKLTAARAATDRGDPHRIRVRELLGLWGAKSRGYRIVDRVSADLENYSLETRPDFRKVSLDSFVELVGQPTASDGDIAETAVAEAPGSARLDVGLTLGNVASALSGVLSVNPNDTLATAMTQMRLNDYSQLAVMTSPRTMKGAVTWRSIAKALAHNPGAQLSDAIEPAVEHPFDRDLVDVLDELYATDFVFVRNSTNEVSGIVTTADLVLLYGETATPFFIVGEVDHLLRSFVRDGWTIQQVVAVCDPDGTRGIQSHDDLTFGDYQRMLQDPSHFSSLSWPLDRSAFIGRLDEIREIRNGLMHFDADPLGRDDVTSLRNFLKLLRDLRTHNS